VDIQGFKSFADRIEVGFNQDVTAVVGPNGCGKSNIADAVRWAMGERSMKKLRGQHLEDVIFSGSETRGPQSMAEVTIVFDNTDGLGPAMFQDIPEIQVTRRYFRDGTSEYLLNKTPCRRRDIRDLFMGTGVSTGAYSMIEQGRIGWIVTSKAEDKRKLIEEAAGVTSYKARKAEAERKMERTRQNLDRTNDRILEIEKNLASLKRQANKARRYQKYHAEMVDCELHIATHRFLELDLVQKHLGKVLARLEDERLDLTNAISLKESEVEDSRGELFATEMEHGRIQESLFNQNNRITLLDSQVERGVAELGSLRQRAVATAEDHRLHGQRKETLERERIEIESTLGEMEGRLEDELRRKEELDRELSRRRDRYDRAGREVDRIGERVVENARRRTALSARMDEIGRLVDGERSRLGGLDRERIGIEERLGELTGELEGVEGEIARTERERSALESQRAGLMSAIDTYKGAIGSQDGIVEADAEALSAKRSRLEAIMERIDRKERTRGPAKLVKEASRRFSAGGGVYTLSEGLTCREGCEAAVAAVLDSLMDALVVDDHVEVSTWHVFTEVLGRRSPSYVTRRTSAGRAATLDGLHVEGAERLRDLVDVPDADAPLLDRLLADVYLVSTLDRALYLHEQTEGLATFVTGDGTIVGRRGEVVWRDEDRGAQPLLELRAEATVLRRRVGELQRRLSRSMALHTRTRERIGRATEAMERTSNAMHELEMRRVTLEQDRRSILGERHRAHERLDAIASDVEVAGLRIEALEEERALGHEAEARLAGEARGLEHLTHERRRQTDELRRAVEAQASELTAWEVVFEGQEAEHRRVQARLEDVMMGLADAATGLERTRIELESNHRTQGRTLGDVFRFAEEKEQRLCTAAELQAELEAARERLEGIRVRMETIEAEIRTRRRDLDLLGKAISEREREAIQNQSEIEKLEERVMDRTGADLVLAVGDHHARPLPDEAVFSRRDELRHLLERMGPVNLLAIDEYEQAQQRYDELVAQREDIVGALEELEKAISKMNRECRRRFKEAYAAINERFQELFPILFKGGQASLSLTDESDLLETGVEIVAQPPGKKLGNLDMMSGGEKALTAVALIFAMFQYRPSPFCLLDEVDAPLDDVNVGRFMDVLRTMTDRSQFILITHSKITMERADVLYGVTMEEPGISKMLSIRLNQAARFARPTEETAAA
jgi:chromosome segregation protein